MGARTVVSETSADIVPPCSGTGLVVVLRNSVSGNNQAPPAVIETEVQVRPVEPPLDLLPPLDDPGRGRGLCQAQDEERRPK